MTQKDDAVGWFGTKFLDDLIDAASMKKCT